MTQPDDGGREPGDAGGLEPTDRGPTDRGAGWVDPRVDQDDRAAEPEARGRLGFERHEATRGSRGWGRGGPPWRQWRRSERPPEWWPEHERWPRHGRRPWRGFGCLFGALFLAGILGLISIGTTLVGQILAAPGPIGAVIRLVSAVLFVAILAALARAARAIRRSGTVLDALVDQAARVERGDYSARVSIGRPAPAPVVQLARGFNTMAARLEVDESQRRSLLADVTHELRTPLTVIQGSVEAILDGVRPASEEHLTAILDETRILDRLIEDLRTLALSESGGLSLHREPTDLEILVGDVATSFAASASAAGSTIVADVDGNLPLLDVDPVRIREVIGNLVANAIRHTPSGGTISIRATLVAASGRADAGAGAGAGARRAVEISVRDTGPGIGAELLPHVFDRFARGAGSSGSGLGLAIARGLVELHAGTITAESPAGGGADLRIRLPVDVAAN